MICIENKNLFVFSIVVNEFFCAEVQNGGLNGASINCRYDSSLGN